MMMMMMNACCKEGLKEDRIIQLVLLRTLSEQPWFKDDRVLPFCFAGATDCAI